MNTIEALSNLEANWNGEGALPVNKKVLERVAGILKKVTHVPQVFPSSNGTVNLEYEKGKFFLDFEILPSNIEVFTNMTGYEEEWRIDEKELYKLVNEFYEGA